MIGGSLMSCLSIVKRTEEGNLIVRCDECTSYFVMSVDDYKLSSERNIEFCRKCDIAKRRKMKLGCHQHYGMLRPLARVFNSKSTISIICKCDCGNFVCRGESTVIQGYSKSCGCKKRSFFYNFEWSGDEDYQLQSEDLVAMDNLVCMLGDNLDETKSSKVVVSGSVEGNAMDKIEVTLSGLREKFQSPTQEGDVKDDLSEAMKELSEMNDTAEERPWLESDEVALPWADEDSESSVKGDVVAVSSVFDSVSNDIGWDNLSVSFVGGLTRVRVNARCVEKRFASIKEMLQRKGYVEKGSDVSAFALVKFLGSNAEDLLDSIMGVFISPNLTGFVKYNEFNEIAAVVLFDSTGFEVFSNQFAKSVCDSIIDSIF